MKIKKIQYSPEGKLVDIILMVNKKEFSIQKTYNLIPEIEDRIKNLSPRELFKLERYISKDEQLLIEIDVH